MDLEIIREIRLFDRDDIFQNAYGGVIRLKSLDALEIGRTLIAVEHRRQRLNVAANGFAARAASLQDGVARRVPAEGKITAVALTNRIVDEEMQVVVN